jgi:hypothetical protein
MSKQSELRRIDLKNSGGFNWFNVIPEEESEFKETAKFFSPRAAKSSPLNF